MPTKRINATTFCKTYGIPAYYDGEWITRSLGQRASKHATRRGQRGLGPDGRPVYTLEVWLHTLAERGGPYIGKAITAMQEKGIRHQ